jgi:hypothetical protein
MDVFLQAAVEEAGKGLAEGGIQFMREFIQAKPELWNEDIGV